MKPAAILFLSLLIALTAFSHRSHAFDLSQPDQFHNGLSLQGFTGILNAPNAHVTEEGYFYGLYSNQKESKWRDQVRFQDNYLFSVGFFGFAEFGGRLFDAPGIGRDLSANLKLSTEPFFRQYRYVPSLAVGFQDIGGGATFFSSKYAVISEDLWRFRLSAGYAGFASGNYPSKGKFAGAEFKACDWIYLLSEYDKRETNVGVRLVTPQFWRIPISFTATAKSSISHRPGNVDFAVGLNLPLDFRVRPKKSAVTVAAFPAASEVGAASPTAAGPASEKPSAAAPQTLPAVSVTQAPSPAAEVSNAGVLAALRDRLVQIGFTNVRVGATNSGILVVEYENVRFNHNELDGAGVVLGVASALAKDRFDSIRLVIKRHDIKMARLLLPLRSADAFLNGTLPQAQLNDALVVRFDAPDEDVTFVPGKGNSGFLKASLMLWPGLTTAVGTDFGVFDYEVSVKPDLLVDLWKGALINARWDVPVAWSDNFDDGKPFRSSRHPARMERLMLFQALKPAADLMINLGGGVVLPHDYGTLNEALWSPGNGSHRFRAFQAYAKDSDTQQTTKAYLGSYRYYFAPLDLALEGTGGRFWAQDTGFALELKRFFGDATVSVYYKNTQKDDSKRWKAAGIQFTFPLTPGKDLKHYANMQLRGTDEWSYSQETTLGKTNDLAPYPLAINPQPVTALYRSYYNRDRLSEAYIRGHLDRLRDAWLRFGENL